MKFINYTIYTVLICLVLLLEATFFSNIKLFGGSPDLVLVLIVSLVIFLKKEDILLIFIIGGGLKDLFIGQMIGSHILVYGIIVMLIIRYSNRIIRENMFIALGVVFICSLIFYFIMGIILFFVGKGYYVNLFYLRFMFLSSIYNMILSLVVYPIVYLISSRFNKVMQ